MTTPAWTERVARLTTTMQDALDGMAGVYTPGEVALAAMLIVTQELRKIDATVRDARALWRLVRSL